jgi:Ca2+-binding RTX toxin-like protein
LTTSTNASAVVLTAVTGFETIQTYGANATQDGYSIVVTGIADTLVATGGSATFDFSDRTGVVTLMGGDENDILIITTGTAADTIVSGSGADIISSGSGNDTITSGAGADSILGGAGADSITADAGNDTVAGEAGNDIIVAGAGNDVIDGGSGDDNITGGSGIDNITAGTGSDTIVFTAVSDSSGTSFDTITDWVSADDTLQIALSYSSAITSQTINAVLLTAAANDSINPSLSGYKGEAIYDTTNSKLYVNYTDGSSTGITSLDYTIAINAAETATATIADGDINFVITGGTAADSITAGGGTDNIDGGSGNDTIDGGAGNDTIEGGVGVDSITGGAGVDSIIGGSGADVITGGVGADVLDGGADADTYVLALGDTGAPSATNFESIAYVGQADVIDIVAGSIVITGGVAAGSTAAAAGNAAISTAGLASFHASDDTLAEMITAVAADLDGTAAVREAAVFVFDSQAYMYISDGVAGVGANDLLVKLVGITALSTGITLTSGNITDIA